MKKKMKDMTTSELSELFHIEMEKTERCWRFLKPLYIALAIVEAVLIIYYTIENILSFF